ncbi:MAG TPA: sulfotransferase domain-containing protein [Gemmataceae bacterium]|nr:sulfotransferase domain-containing protein [Rhizomicrobium sp.]HZZ80280.1 sulfotransferase domain-containing protein [Gemmataceae bacterium]
MLVICYGMAKSGSTLTFEMVKGVLAGAGHDQRKIKSPALRRKRTGNYFAELERESLSALLEKIGDERMIAVKTHMVFDDGMFAWLEELQRQRKLQVVASYRDPRDICLSLVDHGERSREAGKESFAHIRNLERAAGLVEKAIPKFRKWASLEGSLRLYFETVAFAPDEAISAIEGVLGVSCNHEEVKRHAFEDAFTQKNKAQKSRFEQEMDATARSELSETFADFIERACKQGDQQWFSSYRDQILARIGTAS